MASLKKILISIPENLLEELDSIVNAEHVNRSELLREAARLYIKERKRRDIIERMKRGYELMAGINLQLANEALAADNEQFYIYEEKLDRLEN